MFFFYWERKKLQSRLREVVKAKGLHQTMCKTQGKIGSSLRVAILTRVKATRAPGQSARDLKTLRVHSLKRRPAAPKLKHLPLTTQLSSKSWSYNSERLLSAGPIPSAESIYSEDPVNSFCKEEGYQ